MESAELVADAFAQLGITTERCVGRSNGTPGVVLDPHGAAVRLFVERRSLVTKEAATGLLADAPGDPILMVVADRVVESARHALLAKGAGYLDLRGHLAIRTRAFVIDAAVPALVRRSERSVDLTSKAAREVASAILMNPRHEFAVRELARELGRAASTVSDILAALRRDGLTDDRNAVSGPGLFWRLAETWPTTRTRLSSLPQLEQSIANDPLRLGLLNLAEAGWALTDWTAAAAYGAPVAFQSGQVHDFFVPNAAILRRASTLLGAATTTETTRATLRVAPIPSAVQPRQDLPDQNPTEWPLTHPLFVALDLARDEGRGRDVLADWDPEGWDRVWSNGTFPG